MLLVKLAVTVGLLGWLLTTVDAGEVANRLTTVGAPGAVGAVLALVMLVPATAMRWGVVQQAIGAPILPAQLIRLSLVGVFFNQILPTPIGGDAMRVWGARRLGLSLGKATSGVLLERAWGLGTLLLFTAPIWPWLLPETAPRMALAAGSTAMALIALLVGLAVLRHPPTRFTRRLPNVLVAFLDDARATTIPVSRMLAVLVWSVAGHAASMGAMAILAAAMGLALPPIDILIAVPIALLAAVVPISFAGWGVREGALVATLTALGATQADALALSVAFGLTHLPLALPGAVLWLVARDGRS